MYSAKKSVYFVQYILDVIVRMHIIFTERNVGSLVLYRQILFTGFEALSIISIVSFAIGGIIIIEANTLVTGFMGSDFFYKVFTSVIFRELSAMLTAFIIIARSGTAISTEIGNMVVNSEIAALNAIGLSPITYLAVPRIHAVVFSCVSLTLYFNLIAMIGVWIVSGFFTPFNLFEFFDGVLYSLSFSDILALILKSFLFGSFIGVICTYFGFQVAYASTEVPQKTIKAVVFSLASVIIIDFLIALIFYF